MNEDVRITADWLSGKLKDFAGVDRGVNAMLAKVPRDDGDPEPGRILKVYDVTRDKEAAGEKPKLNAPCLVVAEDGGAMAVDPMAFPGGLTTRKRDLTLPVAIRWVTRKWDEPLAAEEGRYMCRAIVMSLAYLLLGENAPQRVRNQLCLTVATELTWGPTFQMVPDAAVMAAVRIVYKARDAKPMGI